MDDSGNWRENIITQKAQYCGFLDTKEWGALEALMLPSATLRFWDTDGRISRAAAKKLAFQLSGGVHNDDGVPV